MKNVFFLVASLPIFLWLNGGVNYNFQPECKKDFLVVSYNIENLMDTIDEPLKLDDEFIPSSDKNWNTERYFKKLNDIADIINDIDTVHSPDLIALIEVENKNVVQDLISTKYLKDKNYKICHRETSDPRGIDVALLYNPNTFEFISDEQIPILDSAGEPYNTREIYLVKGIVGKDTLYVFVNHWKSRSGGVSETEFKRIQAAETLFNKIQNVKNNNQRANIICLGDFNDTPFDISINKILNASNDSIFDTEDELFNLSAYVAKQKLGTYHFRNDWFMLDNIIVSQNMLNKKNSIYAKTNLMVYSSDKNNYYHSKADIYVPNRTYGGKNYYGGVSDHFPVYCYFKVK